MSDQILTKSKKFQYKGVIAKWYGGIDVKTLKNMLFDKKDDLPMLFDKTKRMISPKEIGIIFNILGTPTDTK